MKVMFDVNIWLDIAIRSNSFPDSLNAFRFGKKSGWTIGFPSSGYTTVEYIITKFSTPKASKDFLEMLTKDNFIQFVPFDLNSILYAQKIPWKHHEDACVAASAILNNFTSIVTRDIKSFRKFPIKVYSPKSLNIL